MAKYCCLFNHFNPDNSIYNYVYALLDVFASIECEIIIVSNSPFADRNVKEDLEKKYSCKVIERENSGLDFGAWQWAMRNKMVPEDTEHLFLVNDSVFGPFFEMRSIIERMTSDPAIDFWGMTDCYQIEWHLQSYFLCFSKKAFTSDAFKELFKQEFSELSKPDIIKKGELLLTKSLSGAGLKGKAFVPYTEVNQEFEEWDAKNPMHHLWDKLIEQYNFPYVKRELILQNPENIQNTNKLFPLIQKHSSYSIENIKQVISAYLASFDSPAAFANSISVLCHLYYPGSIFYFLTRIMSLKSSRTQFVFNLSDTLYHYPFFREMLNKYFPDALVIYTPNQGRDIGGKLAAFDVLMKCGIQTEYSLVIHDKLSPHTVTGIEWRNKLLQIINREELSRIFKKFQENKEAGIITTKELIKNEYDPDRNGFTCTSSPNILNYIKEYKLQVSDYNFAAGTIFWIRTGILWHFFSLYSPLAVRESFEKGNTLDFDKGTNIHSWERLFSFIANSQGFKTVGI